MDGRVVGIVTHMLGKNGPHINILWKRLFICPPEYSGKGIGKQLMQRLIGECRKEGYHALIACITAGNEISNSLHLQLGFKPVSHFEKVGMKFGRWLDVFDYELLLLS